MKGFMTKLLTAIDGYVCPRAEFAKEDENWAFNGTFIYT